MTLEEIKALDRDVITPAQAAGALQCDPQYIPVVVLRSRVKIPRIAFIRYMEGEMSR